MIKKEVRIIAWDDCRFSFAQKNVQLVGVVFRGGDFLDGLLSVRIEKDGTDATEKITHSMLSSRHYDQLSYVMLDGITFGGFNVVDIKKMYEKTKLPVIVVQRKKPGKKEFLKAMKHLSNFHVHKKAVESAGKFHEYSESLYYQKAGLSIKECESILKITCIRSLVPEPMRIAHLIASGLSGESHGRA
jgi:endonuclease V-like protein UPF0215 family